MGNVGNERLACLVTRLILTLLLGLLIGVGMTGCAGVSRNGRKPLPSIVWPNPPEVPRISFVNSVSEPEHLDIRSGMFKSFLNYLAGKKKVTIVNPHGIFADSLGRLYIVDTALKTLHVFDPGKQTYRTLNTKSSKGAQLVSPIGVAVDEAGGRIFVTDSKEGTVKVFSIDELTFLIEIGRGDLQRPTGIAINGKTSELMILDSAKACVARFGMDDLKFRGAFGGPGSDAGRFNYPASIWVDADGTILVSDSLNFRIQVFSADGVFIRTFGSIGETTGHFTRPKGVASDSNGNVYVVDGLFDNVQIFSNEGEMLMAFGGHGTGYGEFWLPTGIFIDKGDKIYVADSYNKRVQVFQYLKGGQSTP